MSTIPKEERQKLEDWLIQNLQSVSKSNVERIIDHVERYYYATDGREELEKRVAKLENEIIRVTDIAILCYASRIHTLDEKEFTKEIDKFKLENNL